MRKNSKFGVLSDEYIKNNYADCFLPVRVDKLHSIRQKPASSYVNTSGKRVKEYNSIAPVIPQFVAENNTKSKGIPAQNEMNAIKSDLIRTAAAAPSNYSILQPQRKRQGLLQEDIGFVKISSMANAQDPDFGAIDKYFVIDELEEQAPLSSYGVKADLNTMLGNKAPRHKEDMVFADRGAKPEMAKILDPSVSTKLLIADELKSQPESALFVKRQSAQQQGAPTDLLAQQQGRPNTMSSMPPQMGPDLPQSGASMFPVEPSSSAPPVATGEPVKATAKGNQVTLSNRELMEEKGELLEYRDMSNAEMILKKYPDKVPASSATPADMREFLAKHLRTSEHKTEEQMKKFLDKLTNEKIKKIRTAYFLKSSGSPLGVPHASGAGRPNKKEGGRKA